MYGLYPFKKRFFDNKGNTSLRENLIISRVVLQADARDGSEGYTTHLDLARPDAFDIDLDRVGKDWMGG